MSDFALYMTGAVFAFLAGIALLSFAHDPLGWWALIYSGVFFNMTNVLPDETDEAMMRIHNGKS